MNTLLRCLHTFAVALWFGSVAFFTVAGLLIFGAFAEVSREPAKDRPLWLPVPTAFAGPSPGEGFPEPLRLEQGSRAAGVAVSKVFPFYYGLQVGCGAVALLTALALARREQGRAQRWRILLAGLALASVLAGWWLEDRVAALRQPRNRLTDEVLTATSPTPQQVEAARQARATFGRWHGYSLVQNFATLALATGLTLLLPALAGPPRH
jgi:hypothetical protein